MEFENWKMFVLDKTFDVSKYGDVENVRALKPGNVRYISTTRFNNGLSKMVSNTDYVVEKGNCITIGIDGSFATFYQHHDFIRTTNIAVLRNVNLNKFNSLFICTVIKAAISKYYYGVKLKSTGVLESTEILLPSKDDHPDWDYMTDYIKAIYDKQKETLKSKIDRTIYDIDFSTWKEEKLTTLFEYQRGQRYTKEAQKPGPYPYISSTEENNGVDAHVVLGPRSKVYKDCLTMANSGSRGVTFYHEGEFIASDHVTVLWIKSGRKMSKELGLFLKPIIEKNASRYLYNKEINDDTIGEIDLFLPYKDGEPDWDYMESFIKKIPNSDLI